LTWAFEGCERFRHMNKETKETGEVRAALRLCPSQAKSSPGQVWAGGPRLHQHRLSCGLSEPIKPQVAVKPSGGGSIWLGLLEDHKHRLQKNLEASTLTHCFFYWEMARASDHSILFAACPLAYRQN
jgi:hypothetical protein